jgi:hypothetical protein
MSCPPLSCGPHLSYARNGKLTQLIQLTLLITLSFLILPLSQEKETMKKRKKVEDEVEPRQQDQPFFKLMSIFISIPSHG